MPNYANDILDRLTMVEVWQRYNNASIKKNISLCPFHTEKTPSFKLYEKSFYCFGCGAGGDLIKFVQIIYNLSFLGAISRINYDFKLGLPIGEKLTMREKHQIKQKERERIEARKKAQAKAQEKEDLYWSLWDSWIQFDKNKRDYAPKHPDEKLHDLYVEACHNLDYFSYLIDCLT